jgi:hypothetical protein
MANGVNFMPDNFPSGTGTPRGNDISQSAADAVPFQGGQALDYENFMGQVNTRHTWDDVVGLGLSRSRLGLQGVVQEGFRVGAENDRRYAEGKGIMQQAVAGLGETFSDEDMRNLYAQEADRSAGDFEENIGLISESLGVRGVSGGIAADLAMANHANFQKNLMQAKGNLRVAKINSDAQDAMRNLNAQFTLGNFTAQGADESRWQALSAFTEGEAGLAGLLAQADAIKNQSKNANKAANFSLAGSVLGAAGGLIGGL